MNSKCWVVVLAVLTAGSFSSAWAGRTGDDASTPIVAVGAGRTPNTNATYLALRGALPSGDGVKVKDLTLVREGGKFHFEEGSFYFYGPVEGHVTGAVFLGTGHFFLSPKEATEQRMLTRLTKSEVMKEDFSTLVLRFTDGTADEIRKAGVGSAGAAPGQAGSAAADLQKVYRKKLKSNIDLRLLRDVLGAQPGEYFLASFHIGNMLTGHNVLFEVDPMGAGNASPDQVALSTWDTESFDTWAAYNMAPKDGRVGAGDLGKVKAANLDVRIERSGAMKVSDQTTVLVVAAGARVIPLELYPTLRVSGVFDQTGTPLDFVQEDKDYDADFAVILPAGTKANETMRLLVNYAGKDVVMSTGDGDYDLAPAAREDWYPAGNDALSDYADFRLTFHIQKNLQVVATGKQMSIDTEPGGVRVVWQTQAPIPVAGFNLGDFKSKEGKTPGGFDVSAYANVNLPDYVSGVAGGGLGSFSTVPMLPVELSQAQAAVQVYENFFGKLPFDHVALTQQSSCSFGQSWPMLVFLPTCAFWDTTEQQAVGLRDFGMSSYWKEVTPHEVSHQWWGQAVGFKSYRDQWMSEGFADFSVSLYLMATNKNMNEYHTFWNEQKENLLQKNAMGVRPIDVGPLTMGHRVGNDKTGNIYQLLIYSKGAYVMHMLQMMYWTQKYGEEPFKKSMQTFVSEYTGKAATTEDLKTSFEKTMPPWVNINGDGKLDWFFNEYVYGTELPHEALTSDVSVGADGVTTVHFKVTQSNVSKDFVMMVPLYLEFANGSVVRLANLTIRGSDTVEKTAPLGKLPTAAKRILLNYNADVLTD